MARISQRQFTKKSIESGALLGVRNPKGAPLPPEICASTFNEQGGFDSETIISRHADGVIASRFQDLVWDFSAMSGVCFTFAAYSCAIFLKLAFTVLPSGLKSCLKPICSIIN